MASFAPNNTPFHVLISKSILPGLYCAWERLTTLINQQTVPCLQTLIVKLLISLVKMLHYIVEKQAVYVRDRPQAFFIECSSQEQTTNQGNEKPRPKSAIERRNSKTSQSTTQNGSRDR